MRTVVAPVCAFAHGWDKGPAGSRAVVRNKAPNHLERDPPPGPKNQQPETPRHWAWCQGPCRDDETDLKAHVRSEFNSTGVNRAPRRVLLTTDAPFAGPTAIRATSAKAAAAMEPGVVAPRLPVQQEFTPANCSAGVSSFVTRLGTPLLYSSSLFNRKTLRCCGTAAPAPLCR
jgi:hypothetical protein